MQAGKLRHRIEIQAKSTTRNAHGSMVEAWTPIASRWAAVEPLQGRDLFAAAQVDTRLSHRIELRHYTGLKPSNAEFGPAHRLVFQGRVFAIYQVRHLQERGRITEALCVEEI
jgi:SPP1 family predicted phage head-tail adaptor